MDSLGTAGTKKSRVLHQILEGNWRKKQVTWAAGADHGHRPPSSIRTKATRDKECCCANDMGVTKANFSIGRYGLLLDGHILTQYASNIWRGKQSFPSTPRRDSKTEWERSDYLLLAGREPFVTHGLFADHPAQFVSANMSHHWWRPTDGPPCITSWVMRIGARLSQLVHIITLCRFLVLDG
jgi:hypothetical protein